MLIFLIALRILSHVLWSQLQKDSGEWRFAEAVDEREASAEAVL
jgi:hypothetical protein